MHKDTGFSVGKVDFLDLYPMSFSEFLEATGNSALSDLAAKSGMSIKTLLNDNSVFQEFKGALTEQYVQQQLCADCDIIPGCLSRENGRAEIDFLYQSDDAIIPIEVKAEENLQAQSLKIYREKFQPPYAVRISMSDYRLCADWEDSSHVTMINLPLYAVSQIRRECGEEVDSGSTDNGYPGE